MFSATLGSSRAAHVRCSEGTRLDFVWRRLVEIRGHADWSPLLACLLVWILDRFHAGVCAVPRLSSSLSPPP